MYYSRKSKYHKSKADALPLELKSMLFLEVFRLVDTFNFITIVIVIMMIIII